MDAAAARTIALDVSEEQLTRAKELDNDKVVNPRSNDPVSTVKNLTHSYGPDLTLSMSGSPDNRVSTVRSTKSRRDWFCQEA